MKRTEEEMIEATFKPKINKASSDTIRTTKIEDKLIADFEKTIDKRKLIAEDTIPLFKPFILPKSEELVRKKKEKTNSISNCQLSSREDLLHMRSRPDIKLI